MTQRPSRRQFLETTAAGMALGAGSGRRTGAEDQPGGRPRVAALASTYFYLSHAYHIVGRFLDGFLVYEDDFSCDSLPWRTAQAPLRDCQPVHRADARGH